MCLGIGDYNKTKEGKNTKTPSNEQNLLRHEVTDNAKGMMARSV
jgi:hypothetical protein